MWSLVRLFAVCVLTVPVKMVYSQDCIFTWDNGTVIASEGFGIILDTIVDSEKAGTEVMSVQAKDVVTITNVDNGSGKKLYIDAVLEENRLILKLTEDFAEYEEYEDSVAISVGVTFECAKGTTTSMLFVQPIEDTNNHAPVFMDTPYVYTLPMPFPKNISLDNFQAISARDVDLTNANVTFHLDDEDPNSKGFSVVWLSRDTTDRKRYHATLVTEAVINFSEDVTFTLYAEDAGKPQQLSSSTLITIKVDAGNSIVQFKKPLYTADLTSLKPEEANGKVIFASGEIGLAGGTDDTVNFAIQDDDFTAYAKYFKAEASDDRSTVTVRLVDPPAKMFQESFVVLQLTARKTASEGTTVLHLSLPARAGGTATDPPGGQCTTDGQEGCDNIDYIVAIVILAILLLAAAIGLVVSLLMYRRLRAAWSENATRETNERRKTVPEMGEIRNGSVSPNPSPAPRRSVAFHPDITDDTKIARL